MSTNRIFFSYSFKDEEKVMQVRNILESIKDQNGKSKYFIFMASDPIYGNKSGRSWNAQEINEMLNSFLVVYFLSDHSVISDGASQELDFYFSSIKDNCDTKFLYISLNGKSFSSTLLNFMKNNSNFVTDTKIETTINRYRNLMKQPEFRDNHLYITFNDVHFNDRLLTTVEEIYKDFHNIDEDLNKFDDFILELEQLEQSNNKYNIDEEEYLDENDTISKIMSDDVELADIFNTKKDGVNIRETIKKIESTLTALKIKGEVSNYYESLNYVLYELSFKNKTSSNKLKDIKEMLTLTLREPNIMLAKNFNYNEIDGVIIPKKQRKVLEFGELLTPVFLKEEDGLVCALGIDILNEKKYYDISKMPHCLIGGATNSGKTNILHTMIVSLLLKYSPSQVKLVLADPKLVEFREYNSLPHLLYPIITDPNLGEPIFNELIDEMNNRYSLFEASNCFTIEQYNKKVSENKKIPYILVVIDEYADFVLTNKNVSRSICALVMKARASGIHVILSTQRPTVDVIDGLVKANFQTRIATKVASRSDSLTVLDCAGAEELLGHGDTIISYLGKKERIQAAYIDPKQLSILCKKIEKKFGTAKLKELPTAKKEVQEIDFIYEMIDYIYKNKDKKISAANIQRSFYCGFTKVFKRLEFLRHIGVIEANEKGIIVLLVDKKTALNLINEDELEQHLKNY